MSRGALVAWGTAVALTSISVHAQADVTKGQCVDANTLAQSLRRDGKLAAARAQLKTCADPSCPGIVRSDCTQRLDELERAQPTIVLDVKDGAGNDVIDVRVTLDGQLLTSRLDGTASRVDPGAHELTFEVAGQPPVTRKLLVNEGEKGRREHVVLGPTTVPPPATGTPAPPSALPATPPEAPGSSGLGSQRILGLAVGGVGVVGLGVGTVFGLMASSAWSSAKSACGGNPAACTNVASGTSDRSTAVSDGTISTVGFIAGGVLLATGAVLFLTGSPHETGAAASVAVAPSVGSGQGGVVVIGGF